MSKRVLIGLLVAILVAGISATAVAINAANQRHKCGDGLIGKVEEAPTGNAAAPAAGTSSSSSAEEYWTEERMRNAKPAPMPLVPTC